MGHADGKLNWVYVADWAPRVGAEVEDYALRRRCLYDAYYYWPKKGGTVSRKAPLSFHDYYERRMKRAQAEKLDS